MPLQPAAAQDPALLALDWGSSSLRAFLLDAAGRRLAERAAARGITQLAAPGPAGFEQALDEIAGDWLRTNPGLPVVASGMVGSAQGWREAPYLPCPADVRALATQATRVDSQLAGPVLLAPGLRCLDAQGLPDVMRGEEIQIAGALHGRPEWALACELLLPGTHAKWVRVRDGAVQGFRTYMTGELFALLRQHSLLGRLMAGPPADADPQAAQAAFRLGLEQAGASRPGDLAHQLFATRTLGLQLAPQLPPHALADYLSGLLIGHEVVSGLAQHSDRGLPLLLVGDAALCARYAQALAHFGQPVAAETGNTAPQGLYRFAQAAGLLSTPPACAP